MVHLRSLSLENFMNIESLELEFHHNQVVMIHGDNGSGKTAMLSATALALLEYRKGDTYKDFIRVGQENSHVVLDVLYRGEPLNIDIIISNNKYDTPLTRRITYKNSTYVNSECTAFLKSLDIEYLEHVMFLFQKDNSIVDLKPGERAKLLKKLFRFEFEEQVQELKNRLAYEQQRQLEATIRLEEASKLKFEEQALLTPIDVSRELIEIQRLEAIIEKAASFDQKTLDTIQESLDREKSKLARYKALLKQHQADVADKIAAFEAFKNLKEPAIVEIISPEIAQAIKKDEENYRSIVLQRELLQSELKQLTSQLETSKTGVCYACGNTIGEEHVQTLEHKIAQVSKNLVSIEEKEKELKEIIIQKTAEYEARLAFEQKAQEARKDYDIQKATYSTYEISISQATKLIEGIAVEIDNCTKEIQRLEALREENKEAYVLLAEADKARKSKQELAKKVAEAQKIEIVNAEREQSNIAIRKQAAEHEKLLEELSNTVAEASTSVATLKKALDIFETEFPNFIILRTCSHVEAYINEFIRKIFPYMKVKLLQSRSGVDFFYTVNECEEAWLPVKMASGAQSAILALAWRVAIAKLYGVSTLLLDEVDAEATDENSKYIYEFISSLTMFDQIIMISHRKEAIKTIANLADSVVCYEVENGVYNQVLDPEDLD